MKIEISLKLGEKEEDIVKLGFFDPHLSIPI